MTRQPEPMQRGKIYEYSHEKADLVLAMQTIMERGEKLAAPAERRAERDRAPRAVSRQGQGGGNSAPAQGVRHDALQAAGSAAAAAAARSWRRLSPFWSSAAKRSSIWPVLTRTAPWSAGTTPPTVSICKKRGTLCLWNLWTCARSSRPSRAFCSPAANPLPIDRICLALDLDRPTAEQVLQKLGDYYAFERRGIRLVRMEDSYQLCSSPDYAARHPQGV